jgi:hypothetical protein
VKYKPQDRFGPLGMMVTDSVRTDGAPGLSRPGLPQELHPVAETFQEEWLAKSFTKVELADEIEKILCDRA